VDLMVRGATGWHLLEAKSAQTLKQEFFAHLLLLAESLGESAVAGLSLVYGGAVATSRSGVAVTPWAQIQQNAWE
jgi:hypothetical protein